MQTASPLNKRIGRLTIKSAPVLSRVDGRRRYRCECDCGRVVYKLPTELTEDAACDECRR